VKMWLILLSRLDKVLLSHRVN